MLKFRLKRCFYVFCTLLIAQSQINCLFAQINSVIGIGNGDQVFSIDPNSLKVSTLYDFNSTGFTENTKLIEHDGKIWGTSRDGGAYGHGVVFTIGYDGSNFTVVHDFDLTKGAKPYGGLVVEKKKYGAQLHLGELLMAVCCIN